MKTHQGRLRKNLRWKQIVNHCQVGFNNLINQNETISNDPRQFPYNPHILSETEFCEFAYEYIHSRWNDQPEQSNLNCYPPVEHHQNKKNNTNIRNLFSYFLCNNYNIFYFLLSISIKSHKTFGYNLFLIYLFVIYLTFLVYF